MQQNTLLESYLRQLKLPTFAQHYAAIASDATRTGLSCERYLLALCEAELAQRDAHRVERCIAQDLITVLIGDEVARLQLESVQADAAGERADAPQAGRASAPSSARVDEARPRECSLVRGECKRRKETVRTPRRG